MDRTSHFVSGSINARTHPHFFKPPVGAPKKPAKPVKEAPEDPEDFDKVTIRHEGKDLTPAEYAKATATKPTVQKSKVIKPGTIID